ETIAASRPQRDVYYAHEELGQRLISLAHGPLTLACIARNDAEDHALIDRLIQEEGREGFTAAYFRHQGYPEAAKRVEAWWQRRREAEARARDMAREHQERMEDEAPVSIGD